MFDEISRLGKVDPKEGKGWGAQVQNWGSILVRKSEGRVMVRAGRLVVLTILLCSVLASGQTSAPAASATAPAASQTGPAFDVNAAVDTYLAKMPPAQRARSDAYFEGG
jgi:hypothetical protein